jgi:hypothetical protein
MLSSWWAVLWQRIGSDNSASLKHDRRSAASPCLEQLEDRLLLSTFTVTTTADAGPGSLRQAILSANALPGLDRVVFNIPGAGVHTIAPVAVLPTITDPVVIDGASQPGFAGKPLVELNGSAAGAVNGLTVTAGGSTIRYLTLNRFGGAGIYLNGRSGNLIQGNYIGTDTTGTAKLGNRYEGIAVFNSSQNTIGGSTAGSGNVISGNYQGITINGSTASGNLIQGNFIGTDVSGMSALDNSARGIALTSGGNVVGGATPGARNVISGNLTGGVYLRGSWATGNRILGNFIGTNALGNSAILTPASRAVNDNGVILDGATGNTIGGAAVGARNLISGNVAAGVWLTGSGTSGNVVQGNFIGTLVDGTAALANSEGVTLSGGANGNTVGGSATGAGNLISGNRIRGVSLTGPGTSANVLQGNRIGSNAPGTTAVGNGGVLAFDATGVLIRDAAGNTIGGSVAGAGNLIAGNGEDDVQIFGSGAANNAVAGNFIGTNAAGTARLPNPSHSESGSAIHMDLGAHNNTIGGTVAAARNLLDGNINGIDLGTGSTGNLIQGNFIGTDITGTKAVPNYHGIVIYWGADNTIGGTTTGAGNLVSGNYDDGANIQGSGNLVQGNFIGTDVTGTAPLPNGTLLPWAGFGLATEGLNNTIGGAVAGAGNLISGNKGDGIIVEDAGGTLIAGNLIGTQKDGIHPLGNTGTGIEVVFGFDGGATITGNSIAFNHTGIIVGTDILVDKTTAIAILGNSSHDNQTLGIDLARDGVTPNDPGDTDVGPNHLQNTPVLKSAVATAGGVTVTGSLNSTPGHTFRVEFFADMVASPSGSGEARRFLGFVNVTTDGGGNAGFTAALPALLPGEVFVAATATDLATSDTSEVSAVVHVS